MTMQVVNELQEFLVRAKIAEDAKDWRAAFSWTMLGQRNACHIVTQLSGELERLSLAMVKDDRQSALEAQQP